jgi:glucans biosynthesis protein
MNRVRAWGLLVLGFVANPAAASGEPLVADFAALRERARALASAPPRTSSGEVPAWLRNLSYDQLRRIEFDTRQSLWAGNGASYEAQFLHPGFLFDRSVRIWETKRVRNAGSSTKLAYASISSESALASELSTLVKT